MSKSKCHRCVGTGTVIGPYENNEIPCEECFPELHTLTIENSELKDESEDFQTEMDDLGVEVSKLEEKIVVLKDELIEAQEKEFDL